MNREEINNKLSRYLGDDSGWMYSFGDVLLYGTFTLEQLKHIIELLEKWDGEE